MLPSGSLQYAWLLIPEISFGPLTFPPPTFSIAARVSSNDSASTVLIPIGDSIDTYGTGHWICMKQFPMSEPAITMRSCPDTALV